MSVSEGGNRHAIRSSRLKIIALEWMTDFPPKHGEPLSFRIHFEAGANVTEVSCGIGFSTVDGTRMLSLDSDHLGERQSLLRSRKGWVVLTIDELPLGPGVYSIDIGARSGDSHCLSYESGFSLIEVLPGPTTPNTFVCFPGSGVRIAPQCEWDFGHSSVGSTKLSAITA